MAQANFVCVAYFFIFDFFGRWVQSFYLKGLYFQGKGVRTAADTRRGSKREESENHFDR